MSSAWLKTPLEIYEAHVELPQVGQAAVIRESLRSAVERLRPRSLLYLGCAGGNGLAELPPDLRLTGIDLCADYLGRVAERFADRDAQWLQHDLNHPLPELPAHDLAFGALIFEYLREPVEVLRQLPARWVQLLLLATEENAPAVSDSPYREKLLPVGKEFRYLPVADFLANAARDWHVEAQQVLPLPGGKFFHDLLLRRK